jgi:hypothetical protein
VTATGVPDPEEELTDPEEVDRPELELLVDDDEVEVEELDVEVDPVDAAAAVDAVADELPGIVWALT